MSIKHKQTCGPYKFLVINVFHVFCQSVAPVIPQQLQLVVIHFKVFQGLSFNVSLGDYI